ncbi:MAG TPA: nickel pincer cofactor biosynthesis protein LarC [Acidisarcina sp.]|nr:nickel pincer cofactor biosynthesis protein LarC [Acidisarcina sp.]
MKTAYIECFAGISGDMLLGALVDAGVSPAMLEQTAAALGLGATLRVARVNRSGIQATKVDVLVGGELAEDAGSHEHSQKRLHDHAHEHGHEHAHDHQHSHDHEHADHPHELADPEAGNAHSHEHSRNLPEILKIIEKAEISSKARLLASDAFRLLGEAEARIHGVPVEKIHFHEVGAVDAIVDIVCNAVGLDALGVERWICSPLNVGSGWVDCAHGRFPVPAPATAELLRGAPTYSSGIPMELVTPTGAALLRALGCDFAEQPRMRTESIGYGAGHRNPERFPNVVRLSIGQSQDAPVLMPRETVAVLECAIDDQSPQVLAHCMQLALERGALDVMSTPVTMKKGRLGTLLTLLVAPERSAEFGELLLRETSTLGYRVREESRVCLDRAWTEVETAYGRVRIKRGAFAGVDYNFAPEYEDCRLLAEERGVPVKVVLQAAIAAAALQAAPSTEAGAIR